MLLSGQDKEELYKYIRNFALRASLIIVSSRIGVKEIIDCSKNPDWFNLNLMDPEGVMADLRKRITNKILEGCPVCVETSLETPDEDRMTLETWTISLLPEHSDPYSKVTNTLYNQMGVLLKSLLSITRVVPAYKISQRQGPETFDILYSVYEGNPILHSLGEGSKNVRIGQICTPIGTLQLGVAYRVKMTITPTQHSSSRENSMMLKSDHFNTNLCPRFNRNQSDEKKRKSQPVRAAFADPKPPRVKENPPAFKPGGVLWNPKMYYAIVEGEEPVPAVVVKKKDVEEQQDKENVSVANNGEDGKKCVDSGNSPQLSLLEKSNSNENMSIIPKFSRQSSRRIGKSVHFPFATPTPKSELVNFYRECARAPPLVSVSESVSSVKDITEQLVAFEMKAQEFDEMVKCLCDSPDGEN